MKSIEEYLDDAVKKKSEYSNDFKELLIKYKQGDCVRVFVESIIEEAMQEHAKQCCEVQKIQCAENADLYFDESGFMDSYIRPDCVSVDKESILNTPNVVTTKP